jgi:hypothetical protein
MPSRKKNKQRKGAKATSVDKKSALPIFGTANSQLIPRNFCDGPHLFKCT